MERPPSEFYRLYYADRLSIPAIALRHEMPPTSAAPLFKTFGSKPGTPREAMALMRKPSAKYRRARLKALEALGSKCAHGGGDDIRLLEIHHEKGGGAKDRHAAGGSNFIYSIVMGRRRLDDLEACCKPCHANEEVRRPYGVNDFEMRWRGSQTRVAVIGCGVAGAYLMNRLPAGVEAEAFEAKTEKNWYTVCAWGTSEPFIADMVRKAGFDFGDYVLHRGRNMVVDLGDEQLNIKLKGLVTYDKHRLTEDMLKGKKVHWGAQVKAVDGSFDGFDAVVDATGMHRSLLPKVQDDLLIPSLEYQVKSKELPYDDFVIRPYPGLTGYWWNFPLGDGVAHIGAGDLKGRYRYELDEFVKKYHCEVVRKIGRPVRVTPPKFMEPFYEGKVVGVGEAVGTVYPMLGEGIIPSMQCVDLFVDHLEDREGYRKAVLDQFAIYAKVYEFIRAKVENRFSLARMLPTLLSIYWYMRGNTRRYGLQTDLATFYKIVTRL